MIGYTLLQDLGLPAHLVFGSMLYRAGPDAMVDVMAYTGPHNTGCLIHGGMLGHIWIELGEDLIDFSCGDWQQEAKMLHLIDPDGLPPIMWQVLPPDYLWQSAAPLKAAWQRLGQPDLGQFWYGKWTGKLPSDLRHPQEIVDLAMGAVRQAAERLHLADRLAAAS
jgi:hypothetical protein